LNTTNKILELADSKLKESECLYKNGFYDSAYYLAGYSVELLIKARICKTLKIENFYDFGNRDKFVGEDNITKPYKVHNFEQLFVLSGIYNEFIKQLDNKDFSKYWMFLKEWKEDVRYASGKQAEEVNKFIICVKNFTIWMQQYL